jgi:hypothetical protein
MFWNHYGLIEALLVVLMVGSYAHKGNATRIGTLEACWRSWGVLRSLSWRRVSKDKPYSEWPFQNGQKPAAPPPDGHSRAWRLPAYGRVHSWTSRTTSTAINLPVRDSQTILARPWRSIVIGQRTMTMIISGLHVDRVAPTAPGVRRRQTGSIHHLHKTTNNRLRSSCHLNRKVAAGSFAVTDPRSYLLYSLPKSR